MLKYFDARPYARVCRQTEDVRVYQLTYSEVLVHDLTSLEVGVEEVDDTSLLVSAAVLVSEHTTEHWHGYARSDPYDLLLVDNLLIPPVPARLHLLQAVHPGERGARHVSDARGWRHYTRGGSESTSLCLEPLDALLPQLRVGIVLDLVFELREEILVIEVGVVVVRPPRAGRGRGRLRYAGRERVDFGVGRGHG